MGVPNGWSLTGISDGIMNGNIFPLQRENICIGTDLNACAIIYPSGATGISSIHCQITFKNGGWILTDFSDNGTWLNGVKLAKGQMAPINLNDEIMLANSSNKFIINFNGINDVGPNGGQIHQKDTTFAENFLKREGRINRLRYFKRFWALALIGGLCGAVLGVAFHASSGSTAFTISIIVLSVVMLVPHYCLIVRRLHDLNKNETIAKIYIGLSLLSNIIVMLINDESPVLLAIFVINLGIWIYLIAVRGTRGANRYGPDPLSNA